jgi:hypothetical protein
VKGIKDCGFRIADCGIADLKTRSQESGEKNKKEFFYLLDSGY